MKYVGVRELKESFIRYLNSGEEIVITKQKALKQVRKELYG